MNATKGAELNRRFCVDLIGGKGIYLFFVGLGCDACAGVSSGYGLYSGGLT